MILRKKLQGEWWLLLDILNQKLKFLFSLESSRNKIVQTFYIECIKFYLYISCLFEHNEKCQKYKNMEKLKINFSFVPLFFGS
jgi:hypothetical protein